MTLALVKDPALHIISPRRMQLASDLLGSLDVSDRELIRFPNGLFGFPECREFALVPAAREGLYWLQSSDYSALTFLLVDPFLAFRGYSVDLPPNDLTELGAGEASDVAILAIVTLPAARTEQPTANLQGPLAINLTARQAKQMAIGESEWGVRCAFDIASMGESAA